MFKKIKNYMIAIAMVFSFATPVVAPVAVYASIQGQLCRGANLATDSAGEGCNTGGDGENQLGSLASRIVNFLSVLVGIIAVIMIIVGGFRYITSGGESSNVSGAKNTLIYAIVGLIIVALAQFIVRFVLNEAGNAVPN